MYWPELNLLKVHENRSIIKIINDYKCFEVFVVYATGDINIDLQDINYWTLYVTEQIKQPYHPIVRFKSILDKYYPLEIIQEEEQAKGFTTYYSVRELKN